MSLKYREKHSKFLISDLLKIFVIIYMAHKLLPSFGNKMPALVFAGLFAASVFLLFICGPNTLSIPDIGYLLMIFSVSLLTLLEYIFNGNTANTLIYIYGELQIVLFALIAFWYIKYSDPKSSKNLLLIIAVFYVITAITTYIGCIRFPLAARYLATGATDTAEYQTYVNSNIGGFTFVYELVLLLPLLIYLIKNKNINIFAGLLATVLIGATIIKTEYTLALIFALITLFLFFIKKLTVKKIWCFLLILTVVILIGEPLVVSILNRIGEAIGSETLSYRFDIISAVLGDSYAESTIEGYDRIALYKKSWDEFLNTKMLGSWNNSLGGGHSFILDTLGKFGIIGAAALVSIYATIYNVYLKPNKTEDFYPYLYWMYLTAITMAFLNPKSHTFIFVCIMPLFSHVMRNKNQEQKEEKA